MVRGTMRSIVVLAIITVVTGCSSKKSVGVDAVSLDARTLADASVSGDAGVAVDAAPDVEIHAVGDRTVVVCGGVSCPTANQQYCCLDFVANQSGSCSSAGMCVVDPQSSEVIQCDGPEDCGGSACCSNDNGVSCWTGQHACDNPPVLAESQYCHASADCAAEPTEHVCCGPTGASTGICKASC